MTQQNAALVGEFSAAADCRMFQAAGTQQAISRLDASASENTTSVPPGRVPVCRYPLGTLRGWLWGYPCRPLIAAVLALCGAIVLWFWALRLESFVLSVPKRMGRLSAYQQIRRQFHGL